MKFEKPALSVEQQLDQLVRRGMFVTDRAAAMQLLAHVSYYRLRAYWLPDEVPASRPGDHAFKPDTQFETIVDLYSFDRKLRLLVMDAIERIEVSLRTGWAYVLSLRCGSHGYLDPTLFRKCREHEKCLLKLREEIQRSQETFVLHYRKTYTEPELPPIWVACELLSFGQLSLWYQNLKHGSDRVEIAAAYGIDEQILKSFAHHLTFVRNVCAHHSRLWNREMTIKMKVPANPEWLGMSFNSANIKRLYNTLVMLAYVLDIISPRSQWRANLLALLGQHPKVDLAAMGFPGDWRDSEIWEPRP